jgi:hypothetical protein
MKQFNSLSPVAAEKIFDGNLLFLWFFGFALFKEVRGKNSKVMKYFRQKTYILKTKKKFSVRNELVVNQIINSVYGSKISAISGLFLSFYDVGDSVFSNNFTSLFFYSLKKNKRICFENLWLTLTADDAIFEKSVSKDTVVKIQLILYSSGALIKMHQLYFLFKNFLNRFYGRLVWQQDPQDRQIGTFFRLQLWNFFRRKSIEAKYNEVEKALIEDFVRHHRSDDKEKMAELALILSHFRQPTRANPRSLDFEAGLRIRIRIRIRIGSGFNEVSGSGSGFGIRIRIQEGKNYPQK